MLSESDQTAIGHIVGKLTQFSLYRPLMYRAILTELVNHCGAGWISSLVRLNGAGEVIGKPAHVNANRLGNLAILKLWLRSIRTGNNPMFPTGLRLLEKSSGLIEFITGGELLEAISYYQTPAIRNRLFDKLIKNLNVANFGYLWIKLSSGYTWVACLRRRRKDGLFTEHQQFLLQQIGYALQGSLKSWYIPAFDVLDASGKPFKDALTERQFETLYHLGCYCSRKECARLMRVGSNTIDRNIESILAVFRGNFGELEGKTIPQIIRALKNHSISYDGPQ